MNVAKIKAVTYAITERLKGNKLLKNPKGTPSTTVSVMMHSEGINPFTLDKSSTFMVTTKDFLQSKPKISNKFLFIDEYAHYNEASKKVEYQKHIDYGLYVDGKIKKLGEKGRPDFQELNKRDLSYMNKVVSRKQEIYPDLTFAFLGVALPKKVTVERTMAEVCIDKYNSAKNKNDIKRYAFQQGFFKTLLENLKQ